MYSLVPRAGTVAFLLITSTPGTLSVRGDSNLRKIGMGVRTEYPRIRGAEVPENGRVQIIL